MTRTLPIGSPQLAPDAVPPTAFGKYRVVKMLGSGGFGCVYRCHDEALGRDVAVKALVPEALREPGLKERFLREARALARVNHPSVVQVFDVGESEQGPYFVMELVEGRDLDRMLREGGPLPEARALKLCREAATGLQAAAAAGVIHRDVKPANIMVCGSGPSERVKVTDFGLAYPLGTSGEPRLTEPATILGTPEYLAPEQARGEDVDARADMYALGCSLYELLVGRTPFAGLPSQATVAAHFMQAPTPPRSLSGAITVPTNNLVMRLLAKEPSGRFATYDELLQAFDAVPAGVPGTPFPAAAQGIPLPPRTPSGLAEGALVTANLALCFVDLIDFADRTRQQTREENAAWQGQYTDGIKRLLRARGGQFIKQVYGAVLASFQSPTDAVLFGMSAVDAAWEWSQGRPPELRYQVRVGINMGEVRVTGGDVFGDPVNVAARVEADAVPGQVLFTDAVYLAMNRSEVPAELLGERQYKGVAFPLRVYRAVGDKAYVEGGRTPPFGGRHAGGADALFAIDKGARIVVDAASRAGDATRHLGSLLTPVARAARTQVWERIPWRHRRKVAWGAPAAVVLLGLLLYLPHRLDPYRDELDLLAEGRAPAAARLLEGRTRQSPRAQWLYAKALLLSGKPVDAMAELDEAITRDSDYANRESLAMCVTAMESKDKRVQKVVAKHWGVKARNTLAPLVRSERYTVRHHAAAILEEVGLAADIDVVGMALKDVRLETECGRRREAVRDLEDAPPDKALAAIASLREDPGGDGDCIEDTLTSVAKRIKKKQGGKN